jgi:hypothetical protein
MFLINLNDGRRRTQISHWMLAIFALACFQNSPTAFAQGTAFSFQGRLNEGVNPANGIYDLRFTVFDAATNGNIVAGPVTNSSAAISQGLFTVTLDPGAGVFNGAGRWMEVAVRTNGGSLFTVLVPRQLTLPVPYAVMAESASNLLGMLPAEQLSGTITVLPGVTNQVNFAGAVAINGTTIIDAAGNWVGPFTGPAGPPGPAGVNGNTILNGTKAPLQNLGTNGDFYINTKSNFLYGPKTPSGWGSAVSLVGPQGPTVSTSAVCVTASSTHNGDCNCSGGRMVSKVTTTGNYGQCTVTSDTGSCTAYGYLTFYYGSCCVCAPPN